MNPESVLSSVHDVTCHSLSPQSLLKLFLLCWFVCKSMCAQAMVHMWRSEKNMLVLSVHHLGPAAWTQVAGPDGRYFTHWVFSLAFIPHLLRSMLAMFQFFSSTSHLNSGLGINPARWLYISAFWLNSPDVTPVSGWLIASLVSPLKMFTSAPRSQQTDHTTHSHLCLFPFPRETNSPSSPFKHPESSQRCNSHSLQRLSLTGPVS